MFSSLKIVPLKRGSFTIQKRLKDGECSSTSLLFLRYNPCTQEFLFDTNGIVATFDSLGDVCAALGITRAQLDQKLRSREFLRINIVKNDINPNPKDCIFAELT